MLRSVASDGILQLRFCLVGGDNMAGWVYKTDVTASSTALADLGAGLSTGHIRWEPDGRAYRLLITGDASILHGELVTLDAAESSATEMHAQRGAVGAVCLGANNTGGTLADNTYFWALCHGIGTAQANATHAAGAALQVVANGEADTLSTGVVLGVALETGVADTNKAVYFMCL